MIADEAGVDPSTVSDILRDTGKKYAEQTRHRVLEIADRLGYRPDLVATGVRTGKTYTAGVMITNRNRFYSDIVCGIHDALLEEGALALLCWYDEFIKSTPADPEQGRRIIHHLVDRRVDGIILCPNSEEYEPSYFEEIWERGIPLILVDRHLTKLEADFAGTDDRSVGRTAAEHLVTLGHRNLLYVGGRGVSVSRDRQTGFRDVISQTAHARVTSLQLQDDDARDRLRELFGRESDRPTAVFCMNDVMAGVVGELAAEAGLMVPGDLSVIGCGNERLGTVYNAGLTTFEQHPQRIGEAAARLYLDRVNGRAGDTIRTERIRADLVVRSSTRAI